MWLNILRVSSWYHDQKFSLRYNCVFHSFIDNRSFSRVTISLISSNKTVLLYGINDTKINIDRLKNLDFFVVSKKKITDLYKTSDIDTGVTDKPEIWIFGGSTTEGSICNQSQSWPLLLSNDLTGYEIRNFGRNGKNSDFSIEKIGI